MDSVEGSKVRDNKIKILLADDHPLVRQALRFVLEKQSDFEVVAEVDNGSDAVDLTLKLRPNVVIMDIGMPNMNGLEATKQIKLSYPTVAILVLTVHDDSGHLQGLLEAGASGYLVKSVFGEELVHAIRAVVSGEAIISPVVLHQLLKRSIVTREPVVVDGKERLTIREMEILKLAAVGLSNKDIAQKLNISVTTVKGNMVIIFSKLRVGSRTEAVLTGLRAGF